MFRRQIVSCFAWAVIVWLAGSSLQAADKAQINTAIQKGRSYLESQLKDLPGPQKSLAAYALLKSGSDKRDPGIQEAIRLALEASETYASGKQPPGKGGAFAHQEFAYTVASHIFLLEAADPEAYKTQLTTMARFLCEQQFANGSWSYINAPHSDAGDTSQLQFVLLGLWAAVRAKVDVPHQTFQKAAQWLLKTQLSDGGFAYQPVSGINDRERGFTYSCTLAGIGSLLLVRHLFYSGVPLGEAPDEKPSEPKNKFGVLKPLEEGNAQAGTDQVFKLSVSAIDAGILRGVKVATRRFTVSPPSFPNFHTYLLYSMERTAALLEVERLGDHDWYDEASDSLLKYQLADGSWSDMAGSVPATSFAILCLTKATAKIIGPPPAKRVGGGLLAGARGLPSDLSKLEIKDGQAAERKSQGAVDDLLAELEKVQGAKVQDLQQAVLDSVDLDDPKQLIGAVDRLRRMAVDPRAEVRRTALWAIGRTGDVRLAPVLISGLSDVDVDVIREASFGLAVLSRKPGGWVREKGGGIPIEPLEGLEEGAAEEKEREHVRKWQSLAIPAWKNWYLSVRPYDERDDRQQMQKKR